MKRNRVAIAKRQKADDKKDVTRLTDMDVGEVSIVPKGANKRNFTVVKEDTENNDDDERIEKILQSAVTLSEAKGDDIKKEAATLIALVSEYAGIEKTAEQSAMTAETFIAAVKEIVSHEKAVSKADGQDEAIRQGLQKAGEAYDGLVKVADSVKQVNDTCVGLAKRIANLEGSPASGKSAVGERNDKGSGGSVEWPNDMTTALKR